MTMQNKVCFLLLIFLIAEIQSAYVDLYNPKDDYTSDKKYDKDSKKDESDSLDYVYSKKDGYDKKDDKYSKKDKYDQTDDEYSKHDQKDVKYSKKDKYDNYPQQSMYSHNRHNPYDSSPMNYRSRPQWTPPYENSYDDRSRSYWSSPYEYSYDDRSRTPWAPSYDNLYDTHDRSRTPWSPSYDNLYDTHDRSRTPWSPSYDNSYDTHDRSRHGYGNHHYSSSLHSPHLPFGFDNGPTCFPLLDPQYPLFSDICGAVPQARYSLPNAFGHIERWQIAQVLSGILNPATASPPCTRSIRLLICPLLFPPCATRHEPPPVLPCQPFCRVVKNQCASPSLDLLPCDFLPPTSDLCPVNPPAYGPPLPFLNGAQPGLLTQAALAMGFSMPDMSPSPFSPFLPSPSPSSPFPSSGYPSQQGPSWSPMPTRPSPFGPSSFSSGPSPSGGSSFPSSSSPSSSSGYSSMQSMNGKPSSGYQSMQSMNGMPSSGYQSMQPMGGMSPSGMSSMFSPLSITSSPFHQLLNSESYLSDRITPKLLDLPPIGTASYNPNPPFLMPFLRSATEEQ